MGGFALPSAPSADLAAETRNWVERFLPVPVAPGDSLGTDRGPSAEASGTQNKLVCTIEDEPAIIARHPMSSRRPRKRRRHSRGRRGLPTGGIAIALAVLSLVGFLIRLRPHGDMHSGGQGSLAQTLGPAAGSGSLVTVPAQSAIPGRADARTAPVIDAPKPSAPAHAPSARSGRGAAPASAPATDDVTDSSRSDEPRARYGLEVATFLFEDRAEAERDRLSAAGHPAFLTTETENGSMTYRVVLGSFVSQAGAERAANELLAAGIIQQSRIVKLDAAP